MSHIVKGKVTVPYKDLELLKRALQGLGHVVENERLYQVGSGLTTQRYPLVLIDAHNKDLRIGFRLENEVWAQFQENYGAYGEWTKKTSARIQDRYIAFHYERQLKEEGFEIEIKEHHDGTIEVLAQEAVW